MITFNTKQVTKNTTSKDLEALNAGCPEVKLQEKSVEYTQNAEYVVSPDAGYDGLSKVNVSVDLVVPTVQNSKTVNITKNGSTTVKPDTDYDAVEQVVVNTNIPLQEKQVDVLLSEPTTVILPDTGYTGITKLTVNHPPVEANTAYTANENGSYTIHPSEGYDATTSVNLTVNVPATPVEPTKSVEITQNGTTNIIPADGYDAIEGVDVTVNVPSKEEETKSVSYTSNGSYTVQPTEGKTLSEVSVSVNVAGSGGDLSKDITQPYVNLCGQDFTADNFNALTGYENLTSTKNKFRWMDPIIPSSDDEVTVTLDLPNVVDASYFLSGMSGGSSQFKVSIAFTERSFKKCETFSGFMSNIDNFAFLNSTVNVDLSNGSSLNSCYYKFNPINKVTCKANVSSKCTVLANFGNSSSANFDWTNADTSNVENFYSFLEQASITDLPLLDFSKATNISYMLYRCFSLTNLGGFLNLGKATTKQMTLSLYSSSKLTTESVLNIFNNLYSVNASLGCKIELSSTVYGNLTEDQIAIATNKGWTVTG